MFDGNHRSRRTVSLGGASSARQQSRNHHHQNKSNRIGSSSPFLGSSKLSTTTSTSSSSTTLSVVEESKRQREIRRVIQLQNQSAKKIQKIYHGFKVRQYIFHTIIQKSLDDEFKQQWEINRSSSSRMDSLKQITFLFNIGCRMLLDYPSCYRVNIESACFGMLDNRILLLMNWMKQYHDVIIRPATTNDKISRPLLLPSPGPYHGHQIIRAMLYVNKQQEKLFKTEGIRSVQYAGTNDMPDTEAIDVMILSYLVGIPFDHKNDNDRIVREEKLEWDTPSSTMYWKRLGGTRNFLHLADYYRQQKTKRLLQHEHHNDILMNEQENQQLIFIQSIMKATVPCTKTGRAFHGILEFLSINPTTLTSTTESTLLFSEWIIPIVASIQSRQTTDDDDNIDDTLFSVLLSSPSSIKMRNKDDMDVEKQHTTTEHDQNNEILLWKAVQKMLFDSPVSLIRNAMFLYQLESNRHGNQNDDHRYAITSAIVLLIHHVLFEGSDSPNDNSTEQTQLAAEQCGLVSMIASRIARGDKDITSMYLKQQNSTASIAQRKTDDYQNSRSTDYVGNGQVDDIDEGDDDYDDDNDEEYLDLGKRQEMKNEQEDTEKALPDEKKHKVDTIARLPGPPLPESLADTGGSGAPSLGSMIDVLRSKNIRRNVRVSNSNNLTKYELQTVTKLDRFYAKDVQYCIQVTDTILCHDTNEIQKHVIMDVANEISKPDLILQWGRTLLNDQYRSNIQQNQRTKLPQVRAYLSIVAILLQFTTGLKAKQNYTSPMITKLAFTQGYAELLWKYIVRNYRSTKDAPVGRFAMNGSVNSIGNQQQPYPYHYSDYFALSIFCDIFSHILIVMKDNVFIRRYTDQSGLRDDDDDVMGNVDGQNMPINAKDIIALVRDALYELYWTKPVQVYDFHCILPFTASGSALLNIDNDSASRSNCIMHPWTDAARARTLLSGTKLWNALYERWNRLVFYQRSDHLNVIDNCETTESNRKQRHIICDETHWLFPAMTSALGTRGSKHKTLEEHHYSEGVRTDAYASRRNSRTVGGQDDDAMSIDSANSDDSADMIESGGNEELPGGDLTGTVDADSEALADAFADPKMARILSYIPQAVPFDKRVKLFDTLLKSDKRKTQVDDESATHRAILAMMHGEENQIRNVGREQIEIRRDHLYDDSMKQLNSLDRGKLKRKVQVSFINQHGAHEAGIDGGGVFKEFIDDLITDAFVGHLSDSQNKGPQENANAGSTNSGSIDTSRTPRLFTATPLETLTINTNIFYTRRDLEALLPHYEFLGRVLGKAVYESILVEPQFCLPFLNQLLGKNNSVEDLKNYDPEYYCNLMKLLSLTDLELQALGLTFELTYGDEDSSNFDNMDEASALTTQRMTKLHPRHNRTRTVELLPGGSSKLVTKDNVIQYIYLVAHQKLNVETSLPTKAFLRGFRELIPGTWIRLFSSPYELQRLISGDDSLKGIDTHAFRNCMLYSGGYHPSQEVIQWFWEIVDEMTAEQQHKLLKFMTSCSRQPLLGFASLRPLPCIQQIRLPDEIFARSNDAYKEAPLPTSSTCMNLLKLPNYRWKGLLKEKLLTAIESGAGFELT